MARLWQQAKMATVDIEDEPSTPGLVCTKDQSPNTSIHILYTTPEPGSPPMTSSPVFSEAAKSVKIITRTTTHYVIRRNRARSLSSDENETPKKKKMCHR
jgi:hypothetical protein